MVNRHINERRYEYDRAEQTVITGGKKKRMWALAQVPPEVMYEWIREDRVFKGLFLDWLHARDADNAH